MRNELYHHGIKGQKWGQKNGPPYPLEFGSHSQAEKKKDWQSSLQSGSKAIKQQASEKSMNKARQWAKTFYNNKIYSNGSSNEVGKKYVDSFLDSDTAFYRIQYADNFEKFAFYATYKKHDIDQYAGLYGKNLMNRVKATARQAEKDAKETGDFESAAKAKEDADNVKIYQLKLTNKEKLGIPSEVNAGRIVGDLLKDEEFHENLKYSLQDSKSKMLRPSQQMLFNHALKLLNKDQGKLTDNNKQLIYKALNLSLVYHDDKEVAMQNKFYSAMKKEGYSALLDLNDKQYSTYHAKSPVIVFDTDKIALQSVTELDHKQINKLYTKYNTERIVKEIPEQVFGTLAKYGDLKYDDANSYVSERTKKYLEGNEADMHA